MGQRNTGVEKAEQREGFLFTPKICLFFFLFDWCINTWGPSAVSALLSDDDPRHPGLLCQQRQTVGRADGWRRKASTLLQPSWEEGGSSSSALTSRSQNSVARCDSQRHRFVPSKRSLTSPIAAWSYCCKCTYGKYLQQLHRNTGNERLAFMLHSKA